MRRSVGVALVCLGFFLGRTASADDTRTLRDWMQAARVPETRAEAVERFRKATPADLPELRLLVDDARRVPGEGVARMLEDPRRDCRSKASDADAWLECLIEKLQGKTTVNAKSATEFACALLGARAVKGIDGQSLVASMSLDAKGAFDGAIERSLKAGGDEAIAALYTVRRDGSAALKKWAAERLDALHARKPNDVANMSDAVSLARVISVFGAWREPDALNLVIERVDADRREVREAAREALRSYGREAIWKLREAYREVAGSPAPEDWFSKRLADELFAKLDARRLGPAMDALADARTKSQEGKVREAADAAALALRLVPDHPDRTELAGFLLAAAHEPAMASRPVVEREAALQHAAFAGGDEVAASVATELRARHADALAAKGVADRTLTGASSAAPVAEPPRKRARTVALALASFALILAGAGEWLRRRAVAPAMPVQNASEGEGANEAPPAAP